MFKLRTGNQNLPIEAGRPDSTGIAERKRKKSVLFKLSL